VRRTPVALAITFVALAVVLVAVLLRPPQEAALPSPAPSPTATTSANPTPSLVTSPTASPTPSPALQGLYMSKKLGFALELAPPWHKAICGNFDAEDFPNIAETRENFTNAGPMEESLGHIGSPNDRVVVSLAPIPQGRTLRQLAEAHFSGSPSAITDVTFAGRPALLGDQRTPGGDQLFYYIADGDRFYWVGYQTFRPASAPPADVATMQRIVRSFRFLPAAERQALPDPTPIPAAAPTAQALAGLLETAFENKAVTALERLLGPCVSVGAQSAGVSHLTRQRYISELRTQFAAGLAVTVDTSAIKTEESFYGTTVASWWNAIPTGERAAPPTPAGQSYSVALVLGRTAGGLFWRGTLISFVPPG
jgi:hypothetical protein